ncbi:hypothetical protein GDO81_000772 [Engystomops pustulosus]|uniref:Uncharacterized protein n=1 Tax=Engystomops pustulosus TaxID=76066 RepID=A0AAV7D7U7_ENGPU|nr:hypothetical protein GDO81_000772 [Engystomops pustulosus]
MVIPLQGSSGADVGTVISTTLAASKKDCILWRPPAEFFTGSLSMTQLCMMPSSHMSAYTCEGVAGEEQQDQKRKQWHSVDMCGKQLKNPAETARRSHCGTDLKCDWTLQATRISRGELYRTFFNIFAFVIFVLTTRTDLCVYIFNKCI